jgi:hypothetical protein
MEALLVEERRRCVEYLSFPVQVIGG